MIERLRDKLQKRYGPLTALVVRQLAPIWDRDDWTKHLTEIPWSAIGYQADTFDRGIWVLCIKAEDGIGSDDIIRIDPGPQHAGPDPSANSSSAGL